METRATMARGNFIAHTSIFGLFWTRKVRQVQKHLARGGGTESKGSPPAAMRSQDQGENSGRQGAKKKSTRDGRCDNQIVKMRLRMSAYEREVVVCTRRSSGSAPVVCARKRRDKCCWSARRVGSSRARARSRRALNGRKDSRTAEAPAGSEGITG
eukprot:6204097-Pleurochrysis_carterae.AAC.1